MDFKELKTKSENELHRLLAQLRNEMRELRFKDAAKQLKDVREIREKRLTVANILTLLNSKKGSVVTEAKADKPAAAKAMAGEDVKESTK
jgi:large subunit ribosomal protein L29